MRVVVTGATGYIGQRLTSLALRRGHDLVKASRQRPSCFAGQWLFFDLTSDSQVMLPIGTSAIIHLAANTSHTTCSEDEREIVAAQKLVKSAQEVGAKIIFVSSQTARPDAPTTYGRTKWRIEQEVLAACGWVVRPGLVYGGVLGGLFGTLVKTVQQLPILPAFLPSPMVQPIHIDDLTEGLLRIVERGNVPPGVHCLASPEPIAFSKFLDEIAKSRLRIWREFVPVPTVIINALATVLGDAMRFRTGLEGLRSLFDMPVMATESDLKQLELMLRPLSSGMHPSGNDRRRCLLREGRSLLTYLLKETPGSSVLRRYVNAIEQLRDGKALGLPQAFLVCPIFLSLLDESVWADKSAGAEFSWRLDAATVLAEATPYGAYRFFDNGREHGVLKSLLSMTRAVMSEVLWRVLRTIFFPLVRLALCRAKGAM